MLIKLLYIILVFILCFFQFVNSYSQKYGFGIDVGVPLNESITLNKQNVSMGLSVLKNTDKKINYGIDFSYITNDLPPTIGPGFVFNRSIYNTQLKLYHLFKGKSNFSFLPEIKVGYAFVRFRPEDYAYSIGSSGFSVSESISWIYNFNKKNALTFGMDLQSVFLLKPVILYYVFSTKETFVNQLRVRIGFIHNFHFSN